MFKTIGAPEIIIIAVVLLVLFGGKILPMLGRGLGNTIREFKKSLRDENDENKKKLQRSPN